MTDVNIDRAEQLLEGEEEINVRGIVIYGKLFGGKDRSS
jgi:hypothetical protein